MSAQNIYDLYKENQDLKKLIEKYHKILKLRDKYIKELETELRSSKVLISMYEEPKEILLKEKK